MKRWGGRRELNPQRPEPQSGALPIELLPPFLNDYSNWGQSCQKAEGCGLLRSGRSRNVEIDWNGLWKGTTVEVAEKLTCFSSEMGYKQVCEETRTSRGRFSVTFRWRSDKLRGRGRIDWHFRLTAGAHNLVRMVKLLPAG